MCAFLFFCFLLVLYIAFLMAFLFLMVLVVIYIVLSVFHRSRCYLCVFLFSLGFCCVSTWVLSFIEIVVIYVVVVVLFVFLLCISMALSFS